MPISFPFSQQLNFIHESATQSPHYCFREFIFQIIITNLHLTFFQWHKSFLFDSSQFGVMKFLSTRLICQDWSSPVFTFTSLLPFFYSSLESGNFFFSLFFPSSSSSFARYTRFYRDQNNDFSLSTTRNTQNTSQMTKLPQNYGLVILNYTLIWCFMFSLLRLFHINLRNKNSEFVCCDTRNYYI